MSKQDVMRKLLLVAAIAVIMVCVAATFIMAGTTGIISGTVTDATKGTRLSGVNIEVRGLNLTTVTDDNGYFVITNVPPGSYEVVASMVGYKDAEQSELSVIMDSTATISFALEESITQEKEVTVSGVRSLVNADVVPNLYVVSGKQEQMTRTQPAALYQFPGVVSTQPGVTTDASGYPHVRGGRSHQIGYMVEGIPITEPTTNGFGTNLVTLGLSKMQLYTGGFRAEYGNALSGVFNEIKKTGRDIRGGTMETLYGGQDFRGSMAEFGEVAPGGLDYYVGAYLWTTGFERQFFTEADVADTIGKFAYPLNDKNKLTFLTMQGTAQYVFNASHTMTDQGVATPSEMDHGHQRYNIHSLTWSHNFSPSSFLTVRPYMFDNRYIVDAVSEPWPPTLGYGFYTDVYSEQRGLQLEYTNQASEKHLIKTGFSGVTSDNQYRAYSPYMGPTEYAYTSRVDTRMLGLYVQDQYRLNDKWQFDFGARYDSMKYDKAVGDDTSQSEFSPRFGLTFNPTERNVWRLSWGKYVQFSPSYVMDRVYTDPSWEGYRTSDPTVSPELSESYNIGFERQLSDTLVARITPFYQKYENLMQNRRLFAGGPSDYVSWGLGRTVGCELYAQKKISNNWEGWLSYTWMKAKAHGSGPTNFDPDVMTYVDSDQRNTLSAALNFNKGKWSHNVLLQYNSGLPYSTGENPYVNDGRAGSYAVVSYGITRKLPVGSKIGDSIRLDIHNILNTGEVTQYYYGEPQAYVNPRFVNLSLTKKF